MAPANRATSPRRRDEEHRDVKQDRRHDADGRKRRDNENNRTGTTGQDHDTTRDNRKRKQYDYRGKSKSTELNCLVTNREVDDDRAKRRRTGSRSRSRSRSPGNRMDTSDEINGQDRDRRDRELPKGPRGTNGSNTRNNRAPGPIPTGPRERNMKQIPQPSQSHNPIANMTAAWIPDIEVAEDDEMLLEVKRMMGFAGFKSTHDRKVPGNSKNFAVRKEKKTQYRQYMNRPGGFNRPLSPSRQ